ncbi:transporter [Vibrio sp. Of7-15]|uniref:transporter n=1 Tax=Vibrio sp. Of7-15 TaxID=2724879 RepID=UPI001EF38A2B|nr:transporter [Vibrio sp. Of7-15]MCG7498798.1 transporter [Vibrio sp. Of7-15]
MGKHESDNVVFDYTAFLSASCKKQWTFSEAMKSFLPVFGVAWNAAVHSDLTPHERLWDKALKVLSTQVSDESNLIRLLRLARSEGIYDLEIQLPYALDDSQLTTIMSKSQTDICLDSLEGETLKVHLTH